MRRLLDKVRSLLQSVRPRWHRDGEDDVAAALHEAERRRKAISDRLRALERERELIRRRRYQQ